MSGVRQLLKQALVDYKWTSRSIQSLQDEYRTANLSSYCGIRNVVQSVKTAIPRLSAPVDQRMSECLQSSQTLQENNGPEALVSAIDQKIRNLFWL